MCAESAEVLRIVVHLPPIDNKEETEIARDQNLLQIAARVRRRRRGQDVVIQGDWNVDYLPVLATDPCASPGRSAKHEEERAKLETWAEGLGLVRVLPDAVLVPREGCEEHLAAPISKHNASGDPFGLLDYSFATPGLIKESWLIWHDTQSDHAALYNRLATRRTCPWKSKKSKWKPKDHGGVGAALQQCPVKREMNLQELERNVTRTQDMIQDKTKCSERSVERLPPEIREIHAAIAQAQGHAKKELRDKSRAQLNAYRVACRRRQLASTLQQGKTTIHNNKLQDITAVTLPPSKTPEPDRNQWMPSVEKFFADKWGANDSAGLANIEAIIQECSQQGLKFSQDESVEAAEKMNKRLRMHRGGTCGEVFRLLAFNNEEYTHWLSQWASDPDHWQHQFVVQGYLKGKEHAVCPPSSMRAILPLPPVGQHLDTIIAQRLKTAIDSLLPGPRGTHAGATAGKQTADIPTAIQILLEKAQDAGTPAAAAQCDVHQHYDCLDTARIARWLQAKGVEADLIAVSLAFQNMTTVELSIKGETITIGPRCRGGLTGSRVAGQLGRVPVEASIAAVHERMHMEGFPVFTTFAKAEAAKPEYAVDEWQPFTTLTLGSFVDNVIAVAPSAKQALALITAFEAEIQQNWGQRLKEGSKHLLVARGGDIKGANISGWKFDTNFPLLGITIQDNCETEQTWQHIRKQAFGLFYKIARTADWKALAIKHRMKELDTHILPFLSFKLVPLPLTETRLYAIQKLQRRMILATTKFRAPQGLSKLEIQKRRHAEASMWLFQSPWHSKIAGRHVQYDAHIRRAAWRHNWAGLAVLHADPAVESYWQRTGRLFRMYRGHIPQRWDASVRLADMHAFDKYLILTRRSAKYGRQYDEHRDSQRISDRAKRPCCCTCFHRGAKYDHLIQAANGHWTCIVHRTSARGVISCPHCEHWNVEN